MDWPIIEDQYHRLALADRLKAIVTVDPLQQGDEVGALLGGGGLDDQPSGHGILDAEHGDLTGLAGRFDPEIGSPFGPDVSKIRMGQRFGLVLEQQGDVSSCRLLFQ